MLLSRSPRYQAGRKKNRVKNTMHEKIYKLGDRPTERMLDRDEGRSLWMES